MSTQPAVRASAVQDALAFLEKFERGSLARVMARVPEPARSIIDATSRSAWIGIEHDHYTIDAIIEIFGRPRAIEFWAATVTDLVDKPLLKSFVTGMFKWMPLDPHRVISIMATGWPLVYRDMCMLEVISEDPQHPVMHFTQIAPLVRRHRNYLHSWHGGCVGFARMSGLRAQVKFQVAPDASYAEADFVPVA